MIFTQRPGTATCRRSGPVDFAGPVNFIICPPTIRRGSAGPVLQVAFNPRMIEERRTLPERDRFNERVRGALQSWRWSRQEAIGHPFHKELGHETLQGHCVGLLRLRSLPPAAGRPTPPGITSFRSVAIVAARPRRAGRRDVCRAGGGRVCRSRLLPAAVSSAVPAGLHDALRPALLLSAGHQLPHQHLLRAGDHVPHELLLRAMHELPLLVLLRSLHLPVSAGGAARDQLQSAVALLPGNELSPADLLDAGDDLSAGVLLRAGHHLLHDHGRGCGGPSACRRRGGASAGRPSPAARHGRVGRSRPAASAARDNGTTGARLACFREPQARTQSWRHASRRG